MFACFACTKPHGPSSSVDMDEVNPEAGNIAVITPSDDTVVSIVGYNDLPKTESNAEGSAALNVQENKHKSNPSLDLSQYESSMDMPEPFSVPKPQSALEIDGDDSDGGLHVLHEDIAHGHGDVAESPVISSKKSLSKKKKSLDSNKKDIDGIRTRKKSLDSNKKVRIDSTKGDRGDAPLSPKERAIQRKKSYEEYERQLSNSEESAKRLKDGYDSAKTEWERTHKKLKTRKRKPKKVKVKTVKKNVAKKSVKSKKTASDKSRNGKRRRAESAAAISKTSSKKKGPKKSKGNKKRTKSTGVRLTGTVVVKSSDDLTLWMEKHGVFEDHLLFILGSHKVNTLGQLRALERDEFDKILRVARTEKIADRRNQKQHDKLLLKFEKAWRKWTKNKKTVEREK